MSLDRRLEKLEEQLSPLQIVLRWLDEAHQTPDFLAYLQQGLAELRLDELPINRLCTEAEASVKARHRGRDTPEYRLALRSAIRQVVLRFELVMHANVVVHELTERCDLLQRLFATQVAMLGYARHAEAVDDDWRRRFGITRDHCFRWVDEQLASQEAHQAVEVRYFDGRAILFPAVAEREAKVVRAGRELAVIADALGEHDGVEPLREPSADEIEALRARHLADLVEHARSTSLAKLGDSQRAYAVATAWLCPRIEAKGAPPALEP